MAHILLIDDDIELTALLTDILQLEGFTVSQANDGEAGLEAVDDNIDLILLDVMMPKLNGIDMLKKLREQRDTPVIMLTAKGDEIDKVIGLELGADDYLPKPFGDRELLARIRAILRRVKKESKQRPASDLLTFLDISLSTGNQEVFCQEQAIELTGTEFALLEYLIQHPKEIISKNSLSLKVLGKHLAPFDRAIDMHISNLRKKLPIRKDGKERIKTLRGRGYLLVEE